MNIAALHPLIQQALQHEASTGQLAEQMHSRLDQLHPSIRLPSIDNDAVLLRFVSAYIEQVPEMLVAVGTAVTCRPPHRSVRAELPHTAPASGM